jgi:hypothetical protein
MRYSSLIVLLFVISAYYWNINSAPSFLSENFQIPMVGKLYRLIVGIIGIIAAYGIAKKYVGNQNSTLLVKIVNKIGRETLGLYCIQFHTIYWAMYFLNMNNLSVRIICVFVSSFVLSIFLDYLLNKNRVLAFLFLGKNRIIKIK